MSEDKKDLRDAFQLVRDATGPYAKIIAGIDAVVGGFVPIKAVRNFFPKKSFENPKNEGTVVLKGKNLDPVVPCYILKKNQVLLRLSTIDFSFIVEENISYIFRLLHEYQMTVELIQNSAISFSVCINNKYNKLQSIIG